MTVPDAATDPLTAADRAVPGPAVPGPATVPPVVALDLDRTLIYSRTAIDRAGGDPTLQGAVDPSDLRCVEELDGAEQSFMTVGAIDHLLALRERATVVPTTTRTPAQFGRIRLPGGPTAYAVVSNGGRLLVDGVEDAEWHRSVGRTLAQRSSPLADVVAELDRRTGSWTRSRRIADDLFCYLVVDLATMPDDFLPAWAQWCDARGWVVSRQGRKVYALPVGLTKDAAVAEVLRRTGATRLLAAGDGSLDAGMLALAAAAIRPPHGELAESDWRRPHVAVATAAGIRAGEEMLGWLLDRLDPDELPAG